MPNVLNEFAGDGVTQTFNFSMTGGYLSRDYVYFFTRPNDDLLNYTPYNDDDVTWLTDFSVRTANPIPVGTTFVILRSTTLDPLVDFQNTSRITEKNLDTATWQAVHIAAETSDTVGRVVEVMNDTVTVAEDALSLAAASAADATAAAASALAAKGSAASAQTAALAAQAQATAAASEAADAASDAAAAVATANAAAASASAATSTANTALSSAGTANATANSAASAASAAVATANAANATAGAANTTANSAAAAAAAAVATADDAAALAQEAKDLVDEAVAGAVVSFNGRSGTVVPQSGDYTAAMVGLGNVDNTSDASKPISTATQTALDLKADTAAVATALAAKAPLDSPAFTGTPTTTTAAATTDSTLVASTAFVRDAMDLFGVGTDTSVVSTDLDTLYTGGAVRCSGATGMSAGLPLNVGYVVLVVPYTAGDGTLQIAAPATSVAANRTRLWHRQRSSSAGNWTSWVEFAHVLTSVQQDSSTGAASLPEGNDAARPSTVPSSVLVMRGSTQDGADYKPEFYNRVAAAWQAFASRPWVTAITNALSTRVTTLEGYQRAIGDNQAWANLTGSRAFGTTYTNTTGRSIMVEVSSSNAQGVNCSITGYVNGIVVNGTQAYGSSGNLGLNLSLLVPGGASYSVTSSNATLSAWAELR